MAIVQSKNQKWRVFAAHAFLWVLIAVTLFPLLAVHQHLLRPGNFATGSLIPTEISLEHWKLALGISYQGKGRFAGRAALPGAAVAVELDQGGDRFGGPHRRHLHHRRLRLRAPALSLQGRLAQQHAAAADVPGGAGAWWPSSPSSRPSAPTSPGWAWRRMPG
jgi:ABC-type maltose transport system permease subunit